MNRAENRLLPVPLSASAAGDQRSAGGGGTARPVGSYAAQLLGQSGQKRGLRGGAPVLYAARSAYLGAEYSGENDRRPTSGLIMRKAI